MSIIGLGGIGAYNKSGFADDPNKPKSIDRIEIKVSTIQRKKIQWQLKKQKQLRLLKLE